MAPGRRLHLATARPRPPALNSNHHRNFDARTPGTCAFAFSCAQSPLSARRCSVPERCPTLATARCGAEDAPARSAWPAAELLRPGALAPGWLTGVAAIDLAAPRTEISSHPCLALLCQSGASIFWRECLVSVAAPLARRPVAAVPGPFTLSGHCKSSRTSCSCVRAEQLPLSIQRHRQHSSAKQQRRRCLLRVDSSWREGVFASISTCSTPPNHARHQHQHPPAHLL